MALALALDLNLDLNLDLDYVCLCVLRVVRGHAQRGRKRRPRLISRKKGGAIWMDNELLCVAKKKKKGVRVSVRMWVWHCGTTEHDGKIHDLPMT